MKTYKEFLITSEPFNADILGSVLWELNILGLHEDVNCVKIFSTDPELHEEDVRMALDKLKHEKMIHNYTVESNVQEDRNWNEEWERGINVIEVSDRIVIKPTFRQYEAKPGQIILTIDPKMSFGTGEHQTTKLCLQLLEKYVKSGIKVLDVGTGTAVLAIAAIKLGASSAVGIDNDEWCYENGVENCLLNEVEDKVEIRTSVINEVEENEFELIIANIQKNILVEIAEQIVVRLKRGGTLILSGLLSEDEKDIITSYNQSGLKLLETKSLDSWIALAFIK